MTPGTLLASLLALATLAGAILHSHHQGLNPEIQMLKGKLDQLKEENNKLKLKLQVTGEISIPIEFYTYVERNLAMEFSAHVKVIKATHGKLLEAAEYNWIKQFKRAGLESRQYAFELLRIIPAESPHYTRALASVPFADQSSDLGVYDSEANEILLAETWDIGQAEHQAELIRLLATAMLEIHFPAESFLTDDAFITRNAIIYGRAAMIAQRYYENQGDSERQPKRTNETNSPSILAKTINAFTKTTGPYYIEQLLLQQQNVFPELYHYMPGQSAYLYLNTPFIKKKLRPLKPIQQPESQTLINSELGQVMIKALIERLSDKHPKLHLELAYDHLTLIQSHEDLSPPVLEWHITWTGAQAANAFTEIFNHENPYTVAKQHANKVVVHVK